MKAVFQVLVRWISFLDNPCSLYDWDLRQAVDRLQTLIRDRDATPKY